MSVLSVAARAAARQAITIRPSTLSPVSVQSRCLTLSTSSMANTDLRKFGRDPNLQSRLNVNNNSDQQSTRASKSKSANAEQRDRFGQQEECSSDDKLWSWMPNVAEKSKSEEASEKVKSDQDRLAATLKEDDPLYAERKMHPDDAPDARQVNESSEDAEMSEEYVKLRSQIDYANYPADPKRLTSLKETVQVELDAAKEKFDEVKENVKDVPDKVKELENKIEEKGAQLAHKIKNFVNRDNNDNNNSESK